MTDPTKEELFKAGIAQLRGMLFPRVTDVLTGPDNQREVLRKLNEALLLAIGKVLEEMMAAELANGGQ